jgi:acetyl-CoA carboxylase biotin carboxylase subunit
VECRIYAEDPANNFMPCPGLIQAMSEPGGPGIRNDSGVYAGFAIPIQYDPMISKLVVHGETRRQALTRMLRALEEYHLLGIRTNVSYLRRIIMHPEFISGDYDTHFIPRHRESLLAGDAEASREESIALVTAGILSLMRAKQQSSQAPSGKKPGTSAWKLSGRVKDQGYYENNGVFG